MSDTDDSLELEADGVAVRITHPDRVVFPAIGATKRELAEYYLRVADRILPHLLGRPMVLHRYPRGVEEEGFYQKRAPESRPEWVRTAALPSPTNEAPIEYVVCENLATVLWLTNLGAFEMNPWLAKADAPENPTHLVVDLDPMGGAFQDVCRAALLVREALESRGRPAEAKTSGKSGIHVVTPADQGTTYPEARAFLAELGRELDAAHPDTFALEERVKTRKGMIYFDSNQNGYGATIASAWSLRPTPTATISMPLPWEEIAKFPDPARFNLRSVR